MGKYAWRETTLIMINITDDFFSIVIGEGDNQTDIGLMFDGVTNIEP